MKDVDVFKLGCELGFDIRGAELPERVNSLILVNENEDIIDGFNSNKVIAYNCRKDINIKVNSVAIHIKEYLKIKSKGDDKVVFARRNTDETLSPIDVNLLTEECIQNGLIKNRQIVKSLYK